jgi:hypothetical protein
MAFFNVTTWDSGTGGARHRPAAQEAAQYRAQFTGPSSILDFIELGRSAIEQAVGGQLSWTAGVNFAAVLENRLIRMRLGRCTELRACASRQTWTR